MKLNAHLFWLHMTAYFLHIILSLTSLSIGKVEFGPDVQLADLRRGAFDSLVSDLHASNLERRARSSITRDSRVPCQKWGFGTWSSYAVERAGSMGGSRLLISSNGSNGFNFTEEDAVCICLLAISILEVNIATRFWGIQTHLGEPTKLDEPAELEQPTESLQSAGQLHMTWPDATVWKCKDEKPDQFWLNLIQACLQGAKLSCLIMFDHVCIFR